MNIYKVKQDVTLTIQGRTKTFKKCSETPYNLYVKLYPNYFYKFKKVENLGEPFNRPKIISLNKPQINKNKLHLIDGTPKKVVETPKKVVETPKKVVEDNDWLKDDIIGELEIKFKE